MNNKLNILVVDDDIIIIEQISTYLKNKYNITVTTAYDEAVNFINTQNFDAFILDISLESKDKNGINLCEIIKNIYKYSFTPVLFITSFDEITSLEKGFNCGAVDYIIKPFNLRELEVRLNIHIINAKKHEELLKKHDEINAEFTLINLELERLKEEEKNKKENEFQSRESTFKKNSTFISKNHKNYIILDEKLTKMKKNLELQKKELERIKKEFII